MKVHPKLKKRWSPGFELGEFCILVLLAIPLILATCSTFGCAEHPIVAVPTKPDFAPMRAAVAVADQAARDTSTKAGAVVAALAEHASDTQPARVVVAEVMPAAQATTQAASVTVDRVVDVAKAVDPVEKQTAAVYTSAVTNHDAATHFEAEYTKEKTSWFGGKIGHWLQSVLIWGAVILALWGISKLALSSVAPTGWVNYILLPLHFVANIAEIAGGVAMSGAKAAWRGLVWFWNEVVLKHIPWSTPATVISTPAASPAKTA